MFIFQLDTKITGLAKFLNGKFSLFKVYSFKIVTKCSKMDNVE